MVRLFFCEAATLVPRRQHRRDFRCWWCK